MGKLMGRSRSVAACVIRVWLLGGWGLWLACVALAQPAAQGPVPALRELQLPPGTVTRGEPLPDWVRRIPVPASSRKDPLVLRLLDTQVRVGEAEQPTSQYFEMVLQANASAALGQLGEYEIPLLPSFQRLAIHAVHVLRGDRVIDHTSDLQVRIVQPARSDENVPDIDTGQVNVRLLVPDVRVGDSLHVAFRIDGVNPVFSDRFFMFLPWDLPVTVEQRRIVLMHPVARQIDWRALGDVPNRALPTPTMSDAKGWRQWTFEQKGLDKAVVEAAVPANHVPRLMLQFSEYQQWSEVVRWALGLFTAPVDQTEEFNALVRRFAALPDAASRVDATLRWVQGEIRYYALSLGENSHRPQPPTVVLKRRYGDCKDKALLLVSLLRAQGIPAVPVLVSVQTPGLPARALPSPGLLDHVVVKVTLPEGDLMLDATRPPQPVPAALLAGLPATTQGLAVAADAQVLQPVPPVRDPLATVVQIDEQITIPTLAPAGHLHSRITLHSARAEVFRLVWGMSDLAHRQQIALKVYERRYPGLVLESDPVLIDKPAQNQVTIEAQFRIPQLLKLVAGHWVLEFFPTVLQGELHLPSSLQRTHPAAVIDHPLWLRHHLEAQWPEAVSMMNDPRSSRQDTALYQARVSRSFRGNRFTFDFDLRSLAGAVPASGLPSMMQDLDKLMGMVDGRVVIDPAEVRRSTANAAVAAMAPDSPAAAGAAAMTARRADNEEVAARIDAVLAGGKLKGADRGEALCIKATALRRLGRDTEALPLTAEAVGLAPDRPDVWDCRGKALAYAGQFALAEQALSRALALGSDSADDVMYWRGIVRYYLGRFGDAVDDLVASMQGDDGDGSLYPTLWRLWSFKRAGMAVPSDIQTVAREAPRGAWPRPALALAAGELTPEAMWAQVDRMSGDERTLARVEAWFVLAQYHLLRGEIAEARRAFQQCRAYGIYPYIEHFAAGIELARLPPGP